MTRSLYRIRRLALAAALSLLALLAAAHGQDTPDRMPNLPDTPYNYANVDLPRHLAVIKTNIPKDNPITDHGATLGRVLFYDKRLSVNNTTACAACHLQEYAFSDPEQFSTGFAGAKTPRNAMGLANGRFFQADQFFWDARVETLGRAHPAADSESHRDGQHAGTGRRRGGRCSLLPASVRQGVRQPRGHAKKRIAKAMAQFLRAMVSYQSKYDEGVATGFRNFTGAGVLRDATVREFIASLFALSSEQYANPDFPQ